MERRTEELEIAEKTIVEARLEDWNGKIKEVKCGKITAKRQNMYVEKYEKTTGNKIQTE